MAQTKSVSGRGGFTEGIEPEVNPAKRFAIRQIRSVHDYFSKRSTSRNTPRSEIGGAARFRAVKAIACDCYSEGRSAEASRARLSPSEEISIKKNSL